VTDPPQGWNNHLFLTVPTEAKTNPSARQYNAHPFPLLMPWVAGSLISLLLAKSGHRKFGLITETRAIQVRC
jgi:hypothetical protein